MSMQRKLDALYLFTFSHFLGKERRTTKWLILCLIYRDCRCQFLSFFNVWPFEDCESF